MANRSRRILKELEDLHKDVHSGITASLIGEDISHLLGKITGPPGTPYEGGTFKIDIKIPNEYPFKPPQMKFETSVYHPNVSSQTGAICLDTLSAAWSPVLTVKSALLSLQSLLESPEPKDPQDAEVAGIMLKNPAQFEKTAREWAVRFAGAPQIASMSSGSSESNTRNRADEVRRKQEEERQRLAQYEGYQHHLFENFLNMGFDVPRVVSALKAMGIPKNTARLSPENTSEIIERLLS
ncbi:hypothetical protein H072_11229 [Dactylellina haptotyla CBS 200.50]|uniref:Ubiquitin-conjugating enzyme E2 1 n=1 Tax=Dactylellina haptotyla (strain CBS 200.50) TaxID=1284197 RepID=S7ZYB2_DACHA|nr:hypothetical protein H072_11229 [Dactylellina haptotyla CBS 200.50]